MDIVLRSPEYTSSGGASQAPTTKFLRQQTSGQIEELKKQYPTWTLTEDAQSETFTQEKNIENAILGPLAYKLCFSENLAVSSAGLAILGAIGVASLGFGPAPPGTALRSAEDWADWFVKQLGM